MEILPALVAGTDSTMRLLALAVAGCLAALGVYVLRKGFRTYREFQLLKSTPLQAVNRISPGFVHVRGIAASDQPGVSLLSGVPCAFSRVTIEMSVLVNLNRTWQVIRVSTSKFPFVLGDASGRVWVNPEGAECEAVRTFCKSVGREHDERHHFLEPALHASEPSDETLRAFLTHAPVHNPAGSAAGLPQAKDDSFWGGHGYRFTEECILAGRECNVLGNYGPDLEAQTGASANVISRGNSTQPFLITYNTESVLETKLHRRAVSSIVQAVFAFIFALGIVGLALAGWI